MLVDGARGGKQTLGSIEGLPVVSAAAAEATILTRNATAGTLLKPVGDTLAPQTNRGYLKNAASRDRG